MWWLIGLGVLALAIATALLLRRRSRKRAWASRFAAAKGEVAWFADGLIRQLEQAPTAQQMAGGWTVEAGRVVAVEDTLTTLQASALEDIGRRQAITLRDAVRAARSDLAGLATAVDVLTARTMLSSAAGRLGAALASLGPVTRPPGAHA